MIEEEIRSLFGQILKVSADYGLVRLRVGRAECILTPEGIALLMDVLRRSDADYGYDSEGLNDYNYNSEGLE